MANPTQLKPAPRVEALPLLAATMSFTHPEAGSWRRRERRETRIDRAVASLIDAGYLRVAETPEGAPPPAPTPPPAPVADAAGTARVRSVMGFSHHAFGAWTRGETRTVRVDDATIALVESGYLEPVWDDIPPLPVSATSVQLLSPTGQITIYPAVKAKQEASRVDPDWAAAAAAHGNANPGRGTPRLRKRRH